jgi:hypothetical protein
MKVSFVLNFLNVIYDIFALSRPDITVPDRLSVTQTIVGTLCSILFGLSTTITALYGSRTLGKIATESVWAELLHRYKHTNIKEEALRVNKIMEDVDLPHDSPLYQDIHLFRCSIREHMLARKGLSGMLNILATIFLYYNCLASTILYADLLRMQPSSKRLLYLMLNVVNPVICLLISYFVVLCDNFNSIVIYSHRVSELLQARNEQVSAARLEIQGYVDRIERPLYRQMWME